MKLWLPDFQLSRSIVHGLCMHTRKQSMHAHGLCMDCACILSLILGTPKKLKSTRGEKCKQLTSASYIMLICRTTFKSRIQSNEEASTGSAGLSQDDKQPFFLTFVKGNISRCAGCVF